jgi:hypothetical protein
MATIKDSLEILGCGSYGKIESKIFGIRQKPKKKNSTAKRTNTTD